MGGGAIRVPHPCIRPWEQERLTPLLFTGNFHQREISYSIYTYTVYWSRVGCSRRKPKTFHDQAQYPSGMSCLYLLQRKYMLYIIDIKDIPSSVHLFKIEAAGRGLVPPSNDISWNPSSHFLVEHINPAAVGLGPASSQHLRRARCSLLDMFPATKTISSELRRNIRKWVYDNMYG